MIPRSGHAVQGHGGRHPLWYTCDIRHRRVRHSHSSHVLHSPRVLVSRYAYSLKPNPWEWLTSKEKAEAMAEKVTNNPVCVCSRGHVTMTGGEVAWRLRYRRHRPRPGGGRRQQEGEYLVVVVGILNRSLLRAGCWAQHGSLRQENQRNPPRPHGLSTHLRVSPGDRMWRENICWE